MSQMPQTLGGGTQGFKVGSLKRRLDAVHLAKLDPSTSGAVSGTATFRIVLKGLNGDLNIHLLAGVVSPDGQTLVDPSQVVAGAATMQLTPVQNLPNAGRVLLRPVFQDPTAAQNENHPLPQDIPFGWEFSTEADEVYVDIVVDLVLIADFADEPLDGLIVVQATVEYNGQWWDTKAVQYALGQVQLSGVGNLMTIGTGGA